MLLTVTGESTLWTLLSSTRISLKIHTHKYMILDSTEPCQISC